MKTTSAPNPWYREPWPWLLMAGPALVIVAGAITTAIAVKTSDGVVADDYYKQGLGINRTLARDARAAELHVAAAVQFNEERTGVRLRLTGAAQPDAVRMTIVHPTRAGGDQSIELRRLTSGAGDAAAFYEGAMRAPRQGTWRVRVEDPRGAWRLTGTWRSGDDVLRIGADGAR
jgi:uncharacterized protein